jgi:phage terminase large subunit-like protein
VKWIESNLRHYKGTWAGQPFYLLRWQRHLVRELFGWQRLDGTRLYRRCYVEAPRKAGKSMLAAAIGLYLAYGDDEAGPEVAFAAYDQEQAKICYSAARHMIEANDELWGATLIEGVELPEVPEIPEAEVDRDDGLPLIDSDWDWSEQTAKLIAHKAYENGSE